MGGWHSKTVKDALSELGSRQDGLLESEAEPRLLKYGQNKLLEQKRLPALKVLLRQFKGIMIIILFIASIVSAALKEYIDSAFILIIIILNALLGFVQEYRAEKALEALKKLTTLKAEVIRGGEHKEIDAQNLVPGDIIILDEGRKIPADSRIIRSSSLKIDESMLTGESTSVLKSEKTLKEETPLTDRINTCFMGTLVTSGNGLALVTDTGMNTKIGKITELVQKAETKQTLLQIKLDKLSKVLAAFVIILSLFILIAGVSSGSDFVEMFLITVSLAVSAVPEGLPAVITVTLALGVQRMAKRNALVRRLPAVESLGSANIICTDKTGTLTKNQMTVKEYFFATGGQVNVTGLGYNPVGEFTKNNIKINPQKNRILNLSLTISVLCNNASLQKTDDEWSIVGDHTEGSLLVSARKASITRQELLKNFRFVKEFPFTSERKRMDVIYENVKTGQKYAYIKGAPEILLSKCSHYFNGKKNVKLDDSTRKIISAHIDEMANNALRILLLASKEIKNKPSEKETESNLVFVSLAGMIDPPREEVRSAIQKARSAGIRTIMITGDHGHTAKAIARDVGLVAGDVVVITGQEIDQMDEYSLEQAVKNVSVFARVSPEHKVRLLDTLMKDKNNFVAMTGDGVNDAPAIKNANIGISMGLRGTDVAKESSDIILLDDNYSTIVSAVEEGRGIYDNITKFVRFLLSCNFSELFLVGIAAIFRLPLPLIALQILWLNIVTDGLPALALGLDKTSADVMNRKPRSPKEGIVKKILLYTLIGGLFAFASEFLVFMNGLHLDINKTRTMVFSVAVVFELLFVFSARSQTKHMLSGLLSNKYLILAVASSFILQIFAVQTGIMNTILQTVPLSVGEWSNIITISIIAVLLADITKLTANKLLKLSNHATTLLS